MLLVLAIILYLSSSGVLPAEFADGTRLTGDSDSECLPSSGSGDSEASSSFEIPPPGQDNTSSRIRSRNAGKKDAWQTGSVSQSLTGSGKYATGTGSGATLAALPT